VAWPGRAAKRSSRDGLGGKRQGLVLGCGESRSVVLIEELLNGFTPSSSMSEAIRPHLPGDGASFVSRELLGLFAVDGAAVVRYALKRVAADPCPLPDDITAALGSNVRAAVSASDAKLCSCCAISSMTETKRERHEVAPPARPAVDQPRRQLRGSRRAWNFLQPPISRGRSPSFMGPAGSLDRWRFHVRVEPAGAGR